MTGYQKFFATLSDGSHKPYFYQERVAEALWGRRNLVVRAPTGCGKTKAVLAPFLFGREKIGAARLIYALPLRTLAQGIYKEAQELAALCSGGALRVTIQTGEQPNDPFFTGGDIIVTTYDQVLSGMLCGPYGLSARLNNIDAAAVAGNVVVFDEFHLMEPALAFLTGIACLSLFGGVTRSVWMTATATSPLVEQLEDALKAVEISVEDEEMARIPAVAEVRRTLVKEAGPLTADAVLQHPEGRSLVVLNQVGRAQAMYREMGEMIIAKGLGVPVELLHSRFFAPDRRKKQESILERFGEKGKGPGILIATQVIEAGLNLTCDHLHTEICPMNALVQRAGRCARFPGEKGTVHVHETDGSALPYREEELSEAWSRLPGEATEFSPQKVLEWVESCHAGADKRKAGQGWRDRRKECEELIRKRVQKAAFGGVSHLIRKGGDEVRVIVHDHPNGRMPSGFEGISMYRDRIKNLLSKYGKIGWAFNPEGVWEEIGNRSQIDQVYAVCLKRAVARYTDTVGLELGAAGDQVSPEREPPGRPGYAPQKREGWGAHTKNVIGEIQRRVEEEAFQDGLVARGLGEGRVPELARLVGFLHDVGKLQKRWQEWAENAQRAAAPGYQHLELLAHTDFDAGSDEDRQKARLIRPCRPAHSMASAFYGSTVLRFLAPLLDPVERGACLAAVLAHHGGWTQSEVLALDPRAVVSLREVETSITRVPEDAPRKSAQERFAMQELDYPMSRFQEWWPLASYLTRTLRLSDQRATEEANTDA